MRDLIFRLSVHAASNSSYVDRDNIVHQLRLTLDSNPGAVVPKPDFNSSSVNASIFADWAQAVPFVGVELKTVYSTNWAIATAAAFVGGVLAVLAVLPLYAGWWELGRDVSLNPLETALAFGAPLLAGVNSNADRERVVQHVGYQRVQYGVVVVGEEAEGKVSGYSNAADGGESRAARRRLLLVRTDAGTKMLQRPRCGDTFS